jgi:hypothetical protein
MCRLLNRRHIAVSAINGMKSDTRCYEIEWRNLIGHDNQRYELSELIHLLRLCLSLPFNTRLPNMGDSIALGFYANPTYVLRLT